jgi:type I restriction enzyme S subunit
MSFPRYANYKPSGVEWLGEVPGHWKIKRLSSLCDFRAGKAHEPYVDDDGEYICVTARFVSTQGEAAKRCTQNLSPANVNDILIVMSDLPNGRALARAYLVRSKEQLAVNQRVCSVTVRDGDPIYHYYQLDRNPQLLSYDDGVEQTHLSNGAFRRLALVVPPIWEQTAIGQFLEGETLKIDALIAEQERLIALLAEKRQATISQAVTRGLNPDAPMKDSGVAWLGKVPAHWAVVPLKATAKIGNGSTPNRDNPEYWSDTGFPWLNSSVVNQEEVSEAERFVTPLALQECHLPIIEPPALLVGITGQGKTRGMAAPLRFTATINQHLAYIKPDLERLDLSYLQCVLDTAYVSLRTESEGVGSTKGAITCEQLGSWRIPLPSLKEQAEIARMLTGEGSRMNSLCADAERAIGLLKERRAALIAAAVTGQIDVRQAVAAATI